MGNYVIGVGNYVIVSPSELGNYVSRCVIGPGLKRSAHCCRYGRQPGRQGSRLMARWMERSVPGRPVVRSARERADLRTEDIARLSALPQDPADWHRLRVSVGGRVAGLAGGRMTAPDLQTVVRG